MMLRKKYKDSESWEAVDFDEEWDARLCNVWTDKEAFKAFVEEAKGFTTMFAIYEVVEQEV